jgi:hypothetical protein
VAIHRHDDASLDIIGGTLTMRKTPSIRRNLAIIYLFSAAFSEFKPCLGVTRLRTARGTTQPASRAASVGERYALLCEKCGGQEIPGQNRFFTNGKLPYCGSCIVPNSSNSEGDPGALLRYRA